MGSAGSNNSSAAKNIRFRHHEPSQLLENSAHNAIPSIHEEFKRNENPSMNVGNAHNSAAIVVETSRVNQTSRVIAQAVNIAHPPIIKNKAITQKPVIKVIPKRKMIEQKVSDPEFVFECIVCLEVNIKSMITTCCLNVICNECAKQVKKCPYRCSNRSEFYEKNSFLTNAIRNRPLKCRICDKKFLESELKDHEICCLLRVKDGIVICKSLHFCSLEYEASLVAWKCQNKNLGIIHDEGKHERWTCFLCDVSFCSICVVEAYSKKDYDAPIPLKDKKALNVNNPEINEDDNISFKSDEIEDLIDGI